MKCPTNKQKYLSNARALARPLRSVQIEMSQTFLAPAPGGETVTAIGTVTKSAAAAPRLFHDFEFFNGNQ